MIGKLTGRVDTIGADYAVIDVGGVGYFVHCPAATLARLALDASVSLAIETKVSEEAIRLYGFFTTDEREWFRHLQIVQGVGARVALGVLSALKLDELERAVMLGDKAVVARAQGVGPKLAARIVAELKDRAPAVLFRRHAQGAVPSVATVHPAEADAVAALVKLGYAPAVASEAVTRAGGALGDAPLDALLRESLRQLAR